MNPRPNNRYATALALISLALTGAVSHAAPTVWNVNLGDAAVSGTRQITTSDNYLGAAIENTPDSTWNAISVVNNTVTTTGSVALVTSSGDSSTVTLNISGGANNLNSGSNTLTTGDEIFYTWFKVNGNTGPMTVTFAGLPELAEGDSYALIIYSDWFFTAGGNMPVTQTVGTGLTGTFNFNRYAGGSNGVVGPLLEDTNPANVAATESAQYNFVRLNGLTPSVDNELAFSMTPGNGAVNGFQLVKIDSADNTPPNPNPMTWATAPNAQGESSITMAAITAADPSGVEYLFTETSNNPGGTSSGWQNSPVYTDTGLQPNTTYTYTVTARDKSLAQNQTTASSAESATTAPADTTPPATPGFAVEPVALSITKITMTATTVSDPSGVQYYFTETSGNPGGGDSGWQDSPVYIDSGLTPGVTYTYKVKARDKSIALNETADSGTASATTDPETTISRVWNVNIGNQITTDDNFAGAAPENAEPNSFWNSVTTANPSGFALADSAGSGSAGVTLTLTGAISYGDFATVTGPEIFSTWVKSSDNATPYTMTIGGLSFGKTYDLVIYSDWFWKGNGTLPLTQTLGSGLNGTVTLDQISTGTNGVVPGLVEDTDPQPNTDIEGNWIRITGLTPDQNGNLGFSMGGTNAAFSGFQVVYPTAGSAFATWAAANAPGSTPEDDTDGDGVTNAVEFVLGGTSVINDLNKLPVATTSGSNLTFTFLRDVDSIDPKTALVIETSTDLATWNTAPSPYAVPDGAVANNPGVTVVKNTPAGFDTVTLTVPKALDAKKFARLKVVITP